MTDSKKIDDVSTGAPQQSTSSAPIASIERIEKALEGVTPGPWDFELVDEHSVRPTVATIGDYRVVRSGRGSRGYDLHGVDEADAAYIAACSPDVMPGILALARQAEEMKREIAELREALKPFSTYSAFYIDESSDGLPVSDDDFDFIAELGDFRRARSLTKGESDAGN